MQVSRIYPQGCSRQKNKGSVDVVVTLRHTARAHLNTAMARRNHYSVYVIELSKDVLYEGKLKKCNPDYITGKPCVYVGMTGLDPDLRCDKHKAGIQSNRYVKPELSISVVIPAKAGMTLFF